MTADVVQIIGVPLDLGAGRRGVDMGPSAVRIAGLAGSIERLGYQVVDAGDLEIPIAEVSEIGAREQRYLNEIAATCEQLAVMVRDALGAGRLPLAVGGDHSLAIGSIAGVAMHLRPSGKPFGLIWIDAHGDMNTPETTPSGNIHGMPVAASLGRGDPRLTRIGGFSPKVAPERVALIAVRSLDEGERRLIQETGVEVFSMRDVDVQGISAVIEDALKIATDGTAGFHVSFDMDAIDPRFAPGVGTSVRGGLDYREAHLALEIISDTDLVLSADIVEVNPICDTNNSTGALAVELVESLLGKSIL
ncbi:MAG TPA: arginase [Gemmatimonadota bacterium]